MHLHVCATRSVPAHLRLYTQILIALQTFSGHRPFHNFTDVQKIIAVMQRQRPAHPSAEECGRTGLKDGVWNLIESCWEQQPDRRPIASNVAELLRSMRSVESEQQPSVWDKSFILQLRSTLRRPSGGGRETVIQLGVQEDLGALAVVRPDGYIGLVACLNQLDEATAYFKRFMFERQMN